MYRGEDSSFVERVKKLIDSWKGDLPNDAEVIKPFRVHGNANTSVLLRDGHEWISHGGLGVLNNASCKQDKSKEWR